MHSPVYRSKGDRLFNVLVVLILFAIFIIVLYPLLYTLSASFSDPLAVLNGRLWLLPVGWTLKAYGNVLDHPEIWVGYRNTLLYTSVALVFNIVLTILAAFPLSRRDFKGRRLLTGILVFTMFFDGGMITTYLVVHKLHLINTMWALVLPKAINTFNVIVTITFLRNTIPEEVYEAARVDGCSNTRMLLSIAIPLSKPILAVMVLFYAVEQWNSYFDALIYISKQQLFPLQLILRNILIAASASDMTTAADAGAAQRMLDSEGIKYAVIILASLPMLILYPFVQRFFVNGVMIGSVKG